MRTREALPVAVLVGAAAALGAATQPIADTDLFWHLATGRETLAHGIVRTDLFSWTAHGTAVSVDQWLAQVALYASYAAAGWKGVALVRVVLVAALVALVVLHAAHFTRRPLVAALAATPALVLTRGVWVDRPELAGFVLFAAILLLLRIGRDGSGRALAGAVALIVLWANVHGSFALGAVLVLIVCAEGAWRDRPRRRAYAVTAVAAALATLATPAGLGTWTAPGHHLLSPPRAIQEWMTIDVATPIGAVYAATLALTLVAALLGPRMRARDAVVLLPVALLSLTALRQAPLLPVAAAPLFASAVDALLARVPFRPAAPRAQARAAWAFGATAALLLGAAMLATPSAADESGYPVDALAALPEGGGLLARYEWGGWLIWSAPRTPVFVDGRLTPYPAELLDDYHRVLTAAPGWRDVLARRHVRALLVTPADAVAVRARELGWRVIRSSSTYVLLDVP